MNEPATTKARFFVYTGRVLLTLALLSLLGAWITELNGGSAMPSRLRSSASGCLPTLSGTRRLVAAGNVTPSNGLCGSGWSLRGCSRGWG